MVAAKDLSPQAVATAERHRPKSFISRLGLGAGATQQNGNSSAYIRDGNTALRASRLRPSAPKFLAAFGHSHNFGSGQHPSHYPVEVVSVMDAAGVPLPAAHPIRHSFDLRAPEVDVQRSASIAEQGAKDLLPATPITPIKPWTGTAARHKRNRLSLAAMSVSSSEFSLSVTLAPPDHECDTLRWQPTPADGTPPIRPMNRMQRSTLIDQVPRSSLSGHLKRLPFSHSAEELHPDDGGRDRKPKVGKKGRRKVKQGTARNDNDDDDCIRPNHRIAPRIAGPVSHGPKSGVRRQDPRSTMHTLTGIDKGGQGDTAAAAATTDSQGPQRRSGKVHRSPPSPPICKPDKPAVPIPPFSVPLTVKDARCIAVSANAITSPGRKEDGRATPCSETDLRHHRAIPDARQTQANDHDHDHNGPRRLSLSCPIDGHGSNNKQTTLAPSVLRTNEPSGRRRPCVTVDCWSTAAAAATDDAQHGQSQRDQRQAGLPTVHPSPSLADVDEAQGPGLARSKEARWTDANATAWPQSKPKQQLSLSNKQICTEGLAAAHHVAPEPARQKGRSVRRQELADDSFATSDSRAARQRQGATVQQDLDGPEPRRRASVADGAAGLSANLVLPFDKVEPVRQRTRTEDAGVQMPTEEDDSIAWELVGPVQRASAYNNIDTSAGKLDRRPDCVASFASFEYAAQVPCITDAPPEEQERQTFTEPSRIQQWLRGREGCETTCPVADLILDPAHSPDAGGRYCVNTRASFRPAVSTDDREQEGETTVEGRESMLDLTPRSSTPPCHQLHILEACLPITTSYGSLSSMAPTLFTALASLPSERSISTTDRQASNIMPPPSSSSQSVVDQMHLPGSFSPKQLTPTLIRSRSLHRLGGAFKRSSNISLHRSTLSSGSSVLVNPDSRESDHRSQQSAGEMVNDISSSIRHAASTEKDESGLSPRSHMLQQHKAQLRASRLLDMPYATPRQSVRQQSMFDMMDQDDDHREELRAVQKLHRRIHSNDDSKKEGQSHVRSDSDSFLSDMGCWMEDEEEHDPFSKAQQAMIAEISTMAMQGTDTRGETSSASSSASPVRKAPPRPPRRSPCRSQSDRQDSVASAGSWSRLRKVPMYARLSHLPLKLVEPPSSMSWRSRIGPEEFNRLFSQFDSRELRRQEVIEELYVTEHNFIVCVTNILRVYSEPLRFSDYAFHDDVPTEVARLFHDLDEILTVHVKLFKALDLNIKAHPSPLVVSLAGVLLPLVDELKVYQSYLIRYEAVIRLLDGLASTNEKGSLGWFAETIDRQSARSECMGLSLGSFLLKPVQRLMKYPLFFKQLDELMDAEHPDADGASKLCKATEVLIRNLNTVKAREEDFERLRQLESRIQGLPDGFCLASRQRQLLKEGALRSVRLTEMERITLLERARWELPPALARTSPLLSTTAAPADTMLLRRLSATPSSPSNSPRWSDGASFESGSLSGCSVASTVATTPSIATSPGLSMSYFDLKASEDVGDARADAYSLYAPHHASPAASAAVAKRKSVAGFLLRANQTSLAEGRQTTQVELANMPAEEEVHAFIFDDLCVFTVRNPRAKETKDEKGSSKSKKKALVPQLSRAGKDDDTYTLLGISSLSRVLAVREWSNTLTGYQNLLEVEVMPVKSEATGVRSALAGTITFYFSFTPSSISSSGSPAICTNGTDDAEKQCGIWHQAFERSFCGSIQSSKRGDQAMPTAQAEWRRREKHVTEVVMNSAMAADRVNLAALLQAGLPFPRSPSQQNLADMAYRTASRVESNGLDALPTAKEYLSQPVHKTQRPRTSSGVPATKVNGSTAPLVTTHSARLRQVSSVSSLRQQRLNVDEVPRIGDANAMTGVPTWDEERHEELRWWMMRLKEVERETARQDEVDKMMEARKSRTSLPSSPLESRTSASPKPLPSPLLTNADDSVGQSTPRSTRTMRMPKVRKGLPIVKVSAAPQSAPLAS